METLKFVGTPQSHAHHWLIEEAQGPTSRGLCRRCGAEREFKNWIEESDFLTNQEQKLAS